jgi:hypothetical protein
MTHLNSPKTGEVAGQETIGIRVRKELSGPTHRLF